MIDENEDAKETAEDRRSGRGSLAVSENREARVLQARVQETLGRPAFPDIAIDPEYWRAPQKERW